MDPNFLDGSLSWCRNTTKRIKMRIVKVIKCLLVMILSTVIFFVVGVESSSEKYQVKQVYYLQMFTIL